MASFIATGMRCLSQKGAVSSLRFALQNTVYRAPAPLMAAPARSYADSHETASFQRDTTLHTVNDKDKTALVKANMYKTAEDVPPQVPITQMRKARDYMRVRVSLWMIGATVGGCIAMIYYGRLLRKSGDSMEQREQMKIQHLRSTKE